MHTILPSRLAQGPLNCTQQDLTENTWKVRRTRSVIPALAGPILHSHPGVWRGLMVFKLWHKNNRRQGYSEITRRSTPPRDELASFDSFSCINGMFLQGTATQDNPGWGDVTGRPKPMTFGRITELGH